MGDPSDCTPEKEQVTGSAPQDVKDRITQAFYGYIAVRCGFGDFILKRTRITEISRCSKAEEPSRKEGRIVCELEVAPDMVNPGGNLHGGCAAFLVDVLSSLSLKVLDESNARGFRGVSLAINMLYHAPAKLGVQLKVVSSTIVMGNRVMSVRSEIWDTTNHRLVASGTHTLMQPSLPKL